MPTNLDDIRNTLIRVSKGESLLDTLLEFERTLDDAEVFAYKNWILGEVVDGPHIDRYWYKVVLMFPEKLMPDPNGGLRLTKIGAKVNFKKGTFRKPVKVTGREDWRDMSTKKAKIVQHPVWLVTISIPIRYIERGSEIIDDIILKDLESANYELVDAYEGEPETDEIDDFGNDDIGGL